MNPPSYSGVVLRKCGSFRTINAVVNTDTLYTDAGVANGGSSSAATTLDSSNLQIGYSNVVSNAQIPTQ